MSSEIKIRGAEAADYENFCALVTEVDSLHAVQEPEYFRNPAEPGRKRELYDSCLGQPDKGIFLAELEGHAVGFLWLSVQKVSEAEILVPFEYAHVHDIGVTHALRRKGIGKALLQHAERWAEEKGLRELRLNVRAWNESAVRLYLSAGLETKMQTMIKRLF